MANLRCLFAALFCLVPALAWGQPGPAPGNITTPQATDFVPLYGRGTSGPLFGQVGNLPIGGVNVFGPASIGSVPVATSPTAASWVKQSCQQIEAFGGLGDGIVDNLASWNAWVSSIGTSSACLQLSAGTYKFTGQASATLAASQTLQIRGAGQDSTEAWFSAGNGFNITINTGTPIGFINSSSIGIYDLAVTTSQAGGVNGITIAGNTTNGYIPRQTNIKNVALRGHLTTAWWATDISLTDLSDVFIDGVGIYGLNNTNTHGTGISYVGTAAGTTPTLINVTNLTEFFLNFGISAFGYWQGLNVSQTNIVDVTTAVSCIGTPVIQPECNITASQFNASRHSIVFNGIQTSVISNNLFYQGAYTGLVNLDPIIQMSTGSSNIIANNSFSAFTLSGATPNCIDISTAINNSVISGNTFAGCTTNIVAGGATNTIAMGNINANGTPYTGGGSFFAYMGTSLLVFPGAGISLGGGITAVLPTASGSGPYVCVDTSSGAFYKNSSCP